MKQYSLLFVLITVVMFGMQTAFAMERDGGPKFDHEPKVRTELEIVKWVGEVRDEPSSHTSSHDHDLTFKKKDDGKEYDVVDSPALVKLHHETEKNFLVEIEAEKTPRFLFWGGNLIVKNFRVLNELGGPIPHRTPSQSAAPRSAGERR